MAFPTKRTTHSDNCNCEFEDGIPDMINKTNGKLRIRIFTLLLSLSIIQNDFNGTDGKRRTRMGGCDGQIGNECFRAMAKLSHAGGHFSPAQCPSPV